MFDRFTEDARKTMSLSRQNAERIGHDFIGTEHILLGLLNVPGSTGLEVLKRAGADLKVIGEQIEAEARKRPGEAGRSFWQLPFTPRAKKTLEFAIDEARSLGHQHIGSEHLLLGMLREQEGSAAQVLMNNDIEIKKLRQIVVELRPNPPKLVAEPPEEKPGPPKIFPTRGSLLFDYIMEWVASTADSIAHGLHHDYVDVEHLLLALCASDVFDQLNVDAAALRKTVGATITSGTADTNPLGFTVRAKRAVQYALEESINAGDAKTGARHLLIGIARVGDGAAGKALADLGLSPEVLREKLLKR